MCAAVDQYHNLLEQRNRAEPCAIKDKLAETKRAEREARLAAQHEQQAAKEKREAQRLAEAATARDLRAYHGNSKRHQKEIKEAARREAHKATGKVCEHGVWRCTICFPPPHTNK